MHSICLAIQSEEAPMKVYFDSHGEKVELGTILQGSSVCALFYVKALYLFFNLKIYFSILN